MASNYECFRSKLTTIVDYFPRAVKTKYGEIHHLEKYRVNATSLFNKIQISANDRRKIHVKNPILNIHLKKNQFKDESPNRF